MQANTPALLLTGDLDNITPLQWALRASLTLPRSFHFTFPGHGHGFSISSPCAIAMMHAFLEDPATEPDATCIESVPPPMFAER